MGQGFSRARRAFALIAVGAAVAVPAAFAGDSADTAGFLGVSPDNSGGELVAVTPNAYFVELSGSKETFKAQAAKVGLKYTQRFSYDRLFNGISVGIASGEYSKLQGIGSVKAIYPVYTAQLEPTSTPDLATAVQMTGADLANGMGYDGTGVKVAVMDTGVDYNHPDLGGDGVDSDPASNDGAFDNDFPGSRVITGWDFVGNAFQANPAGANYNPVPSPDPDPDDCNSHGTHVAGIVGAKAASATGVTGVAPKVKFGAYRVFGCEGSTTSDIMVAAMERALADGMHVLNMSIGSAFMTWPQYPTAAAADALVDAGMVVVASIGNSGADGQYSAGAPGVGNKVIGVASFDNTRVAQAIFRVSPDSAPIPYGNASAAPPAPLSGSLPMALAAPINGCTPMAAGSMAGKAVLVQRGTCTFHVKALNAQNAGAAAVVLYNNTAGVLSPTVAGSPAITIPVAAITLADGTMLNGRIASGQTTLTWTAESISFVNPTGGLISSFSSYGMNAELTLKPDIGGPGGSIRSTYPIELGSYATIGGTSMSSPHVAGAAALLRQARPTLASSEFRAILQNSADPRPWFGNPALGLAEPTFRQGAGMVDVDDAILSTTTVTPGKLSLGEGLGGGGTLTIANASSSAQTYALSHLGSVGTSGTATAAPSPVTNPPFTFGYLGPAQTATFSAPSVTVPAGGTGTVGVSIAVDPTYPDRSQYGGWIVLTRQSDGQVFRVPYGGLKGDYQSIQHLRFAILGRIVNGAIVQMTPATSTFTLAGSDVPIVMPNLGHQARRLEIQVVDAATGAPVHPVFSNATEQDYLARNQTANTVFTFAFDGTRMHDNGIGTADHRKVVPDGQYKLVLKVLKALGDASNPADWETWTSPTITIDRP